METYTTWARMFELQRYYSWIVDRFHLSTRMYQLQTHNKDYDFRWLEERLLPLGFHIVLLTRSPESFEAARAERLKVSGNPSQYDDLQLFIEEQKLIRRLANQFSPCLNWIFQIIISNLPWKTSRTGWSQPLDCTCHN